VWKLVLGRLTPCTPDVIQDSMYKGTFRHDDYVHPRLLNRMGREGINLRIEVTFAISKEWKATWLPIYEWLAEHRVSYWTYSPFSTDYRRYFGFERAQDAMLFKLAFA